MADGFFPTLVSKDENANAQTNPLWARLTDGTNAAAFTGTSLNVNITGGASSGTEFAEDAAHTSGDLGIQVLAVRQDTLASSTSADGDYASLKVTAAGALYTSVVNSVTVTATDLDIRDLNSATDSVTVVATNLDIRDLNSATDSVAVTDGGGSLTVDATDLDIRDLTLATDAVQVSGNSTANSATNPLFVQNINRAITGEVHNYNTTTVSGGGTSNHDYTATNTMLVHQVSVSSSGASKVELIVNSVSKFVGFIPKEGGTLVKTFNPPIEATATQVVRLTRTNREGASQDLYSTIEGIDAA